MNYVIKPKAKRKQFLSSSWILLFPIAFYVSGLFLIPNENIDHLKRIGYAEQHEYTWYDSDGEEHEDETLITIDGVGRILTYKDLYFSAITLFVPALVLGGIVFGQRVNGIKCLIFCNCLIGVTLLKLTTSQHLTSTILYWTGIAAAFFCIKLGEHKPDQ